MHDATKLKIPHRIQHSLEADVEFQDQATDTYVSFKIPIIIKEIVVAKMEIQKQGNRYPNRVRDDGTGYQQKLRIDHKPKHPYTSFPNLRKTSKS